MSDLVPMKNCPGVLLDVPFRLIRKSYMLHYPGTYVSEKKKHDHQNGTNCTSCIARNYAHL